MNCVRFLVCLAVVIFAFSASAQIYKYTDEEGNVRFTDDLNQVPADQRDSVSASSEIEDETDH